MAFKVGERTFEIQIASDVVRDRLGAELWDKDLNKMLIEIFRNDCKKEIEFFTGGCDIPFEAVEILISKFESAVGRIFQDDPGF